MLIISLDILSRWIFFFFISNRSISIEFNSACTWLLRNFWLINHILLLLLKNLLLSYFIGDVNFRILNNSLLLIDLISQLLIWSYHLCSTNKFINVIKSILHFIFSVTLFSFSLSFLFFKFLFLFYFKLFCYLSFTILLKFF